MQHVTAFGELNSMSSLSISTHSMDSVRLVTLYLYGEMTALLVDISHLFRMVIIPHCDKQHDQRGYYDRILQL